MNGSAAANSTAEPESGLSAWFARRSVTQLGQIAVLIVLAVTAAFGGLSTVDKAVTAISPGKPFDDGPFTVTIDRARLVPRLVAGSRAIFPPQPHRRYLAVVATLTSTGTTPVTLSNELDLVGVRDAKWAGAVRLADSTTTYWQGPGLTDQLAFVWNVPDTAVAVGDAVRIRIWKKQFTELKVTYGRTWIDSLTEYAELSLPATSVT